jgi:hypothetical protein
MESVFGSLKVEQVHHCRFRTRREGKRCGVGTLRQAVAL